MLKASAKKMYWNIRNWKMTVFSLLAALSKSPTSYLREETGVAWGRKKEGHRSSQ